MVNQYNLLVDLVGALLVIAIQIAERRQKQRGDSQNAKLLNHLMLCCTLVFLVDIPGLLLDGRTFQLARPLLWVADSTYWILQVVYCWLWLLFSDYWANGSKEHLKRWGIFYALPMLVEIPLITAPSISAQQQTATIPQAPISASYTVLHSYRPARPARQLRQRMNLRLRFMWMALNTTLASLKQQTVLPRLPRMKNC